MVLHSVREQDMFSHIHRVCGTCPIPISSGIERTARMRIFPMLMPRRLDHYARLAYIVKTGKHQRTGTEFTDHRRLMLRSGCICVWSHISSSFQVFRRDERWRKPDDILRLYKESGSREYSQCVLQAVEFKSYLESI